jgi:hypothetical protein
VILAATSFEAALDELDAHRHANNATNYALSKLPSATANVEAGGEMWVLLARQEMKGEPAPGFEWQKGWKAVEYTFASETAALQWAQDNGWNNPPIYNYRASRIHPASAPAKTADYECGVEDAAKACDRLRQCAASNVENGRKNLQHLIDSDGDMNEIEGAEFSIHSSQGAFNVLQAAAFTIRALKSTTANQGERKCK